MKQRDAFQTIEMVLLRKWVFLFRVNKLLLKSIIFPLLAASITLQAQTSNIQFWEEYMLEYPFANAFNLENAFVYSTLANSPRWYALDYSPSLEYSLSQHIDLTTGSTFSFTVQDEDYNTFEIRPMVGTRIHLTPNQRVLTRVFLRLEQRNFLNLDSSTWESTFRPRIRAEALIPLNKKSYFEDKLWYGIVDVEWLFSVEDVQERFANRFRVRAGIGYRLNYTSRFEFIYMNQQSRNGIDEHYESSDNIFRFRYKQFLNKAKPSKLSGSGN